jgi:DNA-directed RNA polymerase specialized sigma24 family protein
VVKDKPPDLSNENDDRLLVLIGAKVAGPEILREAWAELYRRHAEYLFQKLYGAVAGNSHDEDRLNDLLSETFRHVYEQAAATFKPSGSTDKDEIRRHVRAWLGSIARRLFQESWRKRSQSSEKQGSERYWEVVREPQHLASEGSNDADRVREIVRVILNEREQEILRVRMLHYDVSKDYKRLPHEVLVELSSRLDMKPDAIRKAYERILQKIKDALTRPGSAQP